MIAYVHYLALCTLITYGLTASTLFMPLRMLLSVRSNWLRMLIYCPTCMGFWVSLGCAWLYPSDVIWERFVYGPALFIAATLMIKLYDMGWLVASTIEAEFAALDATLRPTEPGNEDSGQST